MGFFLPLKSCKSCQSCSKKFFPPFAFSPQSANHGPSRRHRSWHCLLPASCGGQYVGVSAMGARLSAGWLGCLDGGGRPAAPSASTRTDRTCEPAASANLGHWNKIVGEFGLGDRASLFFAGDAPRTSPRLIDFARDAELFFNISGHFKQRDVFTAPKDAVSTSISTRPSLKSRRRSITPTCTSTATIRLRLHRAAPRPGRLPRADGRAECGRSAHSRRARSFYESQPRSTRATTAWTTFTHWYGYPQVEYGRGTATSRRNSPS